MKDNLTTQERLSHLSDVQRFALDVVREVNERHCGQLIDDLKMDLIEGIPSEHLTYPVVKMGARYATITHLGLVKDEKGSLQSISTPQERWLAVQQHFSHCVLNARSAETRILKPFFMAHWAGHPEEAKLVLNKDKYPTPEHFWVERMDGFSGKEDVILTWNDLVSLGAIVREWDEGEVVCHYELNQSVFEAFKDGIQGGALDESGVEYARSVFGEALE